MRQLLSLTTILMCLLRPFQSQLNLGQWQPQKFCSLVYRDHSFRKRAITEAVEPNGPLSLSAYVWWLKLLRFLRAPTARNRLKSIDERGFINDANLAQSHKHGGTANAVEFLEAYQLSVAKCLAMISDFTKQMLLGHQKRPGKKVGRFLHFFFGHACTINEAVRQFVCESQPPALQGKMVVHDNDRQVCGVRALHETSKSRHTVGKVHG